MRGGCGGGAEMGWRGRKSVDYEEVCPGCISSGYTIQNSWIGSVVYSIRSLVMWWDWLK